MQQGRSSGGRGVAVCIVGGVLVGSTLLYCAAMGSPHQALHRLMAYEVLPPIWLLSLLWLAVLFVMGATAADLLRGSKGGMISEAFAWQGSTWLALSLGTSVAWYALLFVKFSLLASWICLLLTLGCAVLCFLSWIRIQPRCGIPAAVYCLWLIAMSIAQLLIMLRL